MEPKYIVLIVISSVIVFIILALLIMALLIHHKIFEQRFTPDPLIPVYDPSSLGLSLEPVEFDCKGHKLKGNIYTKGEYNKDVIVVFCHGMWSRIDSYNQEIGYLCDNGYQVLGFNYIGTDTSEGKNTRGFGSSVKCADYAIRYIKSHDEFKNRKIYVMGHSWGGFATCNVIHYHKDIKKIVALAPFVSVGKVVGQSVPKSFKMIIPFVVLADYIKNGSYSFRNSIKSLKSFKGDALILHSKNDFMVKYEANTVPLMRECKNAKFLISENKYHNPDYSDDALKIMVNFYKEIKGKTAEEANEIKKRTDFIAMGKLDDEVMNNIISFLNE